MKPSLLADLSVTDVLDVVVKLPQSAFEDTQLSAGCPSADCPVRTIEFWPVEPFSLVQIPPLVVARVEEKFGPEEFHTCP